MARSCKFLKDYNGAKGSRLVLTDLFAVSEVNTFRRHFLDNGRPIATVGLTTRGNIGILDEINDDPIMTTYRLIDEPISEELFQYAEGQNRLRFPEDMADDVIQIR